MGDCGNTPLCQAITQMHLITHNVGSGWVQMHRPIAVLQFGLLCGPEQDVGRESRIYLSCTSHFGAHTEAATTNHNSS